MFDTVFDRGPPARGPPPGRSPPPRTDCVDPESAKIVKNACNGLRTCQLKADGSIFGNACQDVHSFLEVQYVCLTRDEKPLRKYCCSHRKYYIFILLQINQVVKCIMAHFCENSNDSKSCVCLTLSQNIKK